MRKILAMLLLVCATSVFADQCPDTIDNQTDLTGWSLVNMSELNYPGEFVSARYITSFGVMNGLVICDYLDQNAMPFYLMSQNAYPNPNPHGSKRSDWIPKRSPFAHLICTVSAQDCVF